jgi:ribonuclease VapC
VLDASALLTVLNNEPGADVLPPSLLTDAVMSAVNMAEVHTKLLKAGLTAEDSWKAAVSPIAGIMPFTEEHAKRTGSLSAETRALGLSLGDRACLALALSLKAPVYTADRSWKKLHIAVPIHVIR